jgi:hypothetical protein
MKKLFIPFLLCVMPLILFAQKDADSFKSRVMAFGIISGIPNNSFGVMTVINIPNTDFGIYMDYKMGFGDETKGTNYTGIISFHTADSVYGDRYLGEKTSGVFTLNFGLSYDLTKRKSLYLYGTGGFSMSSTFRQYFDATKILDDTGYYLIEDTDKSYFGFNASLGSYYYLTQYFAIQLGFDTNPKNVVIGISFGF